MGTLVSVGIVTTADVTGSVGLENLSPTAGTAGATQTGTVNAYDASGDWLSSATASDNTTAALSAFDGTDNFAGTSGTYRSLLMGTGSTTYYGPPSGFTGTTPVTLTVKSSTSVSESGPGNLQIYSLADVGASVSLEYVYIPAGSDQSVSTSGATTVAITYSYVPATVTNTATTTPQTFVIADAETGWTQALSVAQFNPALGTLDAVDIVLDGNANEIFKLQNVSPSVATVDASEVTSFEITGAWQSVQHDHLDTGCNR